MLNVGHLARYVRTATHLRRLLGPHPGLMDLGSEVREVGPTGTEIGQLPPDVQQRLSALQEAQQKQVSLMEQAAGRVSEARQQINELLLATERGFKEALLDARNAVPAAALDRLKHSRFAIRAPEPEPAGDSGRGQTPQMAQAHGYTCEGCFVREPGLALTPDHCLGEHQKVGDTVRVFMLADRAELSLTILKRDAELGFALLRYDVPVDSPPRAPGTALLEVDDTGQDALHCGATLALCACSVSFRMLEGDVERTARPQLAVMPAAAFRSSADDRHLVYVCQCFSGECGFALVLHYGKLLGLHLEGVNQFKERVFKKRATEPLTAAEASLVAAATSVARGWIALSARALM